MFYRGLYLNKHTHDGKHNTLAHAFTQKQPHAYTHSHNTLTHTTHSLTQHTHSHNTLTHTGTTTRINSYALMVVIYQFSFYIHYRAAVNSQLLMYNTSIRKTAYL